MLKKLGRRLTLLNVLISGAILITMAFVSLSVTERMMQAQNQQELQENLTRLASAVEETKDQSVLVKISMPKQYAGFVEGEAQDYRLIFDQVVSDDMAQVVLPFVRSGIESQASEDGGHVNVFYTYQMEPKSTEEPVVVTIAVDDHVANEDAFQAVDAGEAFITTTAGEKAFTVGTVQVLQADDAGEHDITATERIKVPAVDDVDTHTIVLQENVLQAGDAAVSYRIAATMSGGTDQRVLMVMQDRTGELYERDRLRTLFGLCVLGGLLLIVLGSLYYSAKAVQPVETAMRRQQEFVSAASHELRTPIAAVRANAEVLGDAQLGSYQPYLGAIQSESEKMSKLVSDLLNLARADAGELPIERRLVDAADVCKDAAALIEPITERRAQKLDCALQIALITGDPDRLRQALVALLDNATRYAPEGGTVGIACQKRDHTVEIRVEDDGPGVASEHKARIFDRFYRADAARSREQGGAGLGLSIARELVVRMAGTIEVEDRPGGGARFVLIFPAVFKA